MGNGAREPLQDDALVVRFNLAEVSLLRGNVERTFQQLGFYGLSFAGENDLTEAEIAKAFPFPSDWMVLSTVGRFREAGYELVRSGRWPHLSLRFDSEPSDEELKRIADLFDLPVENPHSL